MAAKNLKRFLLVLGIALLLPGAAGAAGFGTVERSFWEDGAAFFARLWDGLTATWTLGDPIDPHGAETNSGGSIDPNGGDQIDSGGSIDPNG